MRQIISDMHRYCHLTHPVYARLSDSGILEFVVWGVHIPPNPPPPKKKEQKKPKNTPKRTLKCLILPPEKKQLKKHLKIFKTWNGRVSQIFITCISTIIWRINTHNITNQAITGRLILHTLFQIISYLVNIEFLQFFKNLAVTFCQYRLNVCLFS